MKTQVNSTPIRLDGSITCYQNPLNNPHKRIERALSSDGYSIRPGLVNGTNCPRTISPKDNRTW